MDGKNFTRAPGNEIPFMGIKNNNITFESTKDFVTWEPSQMLQYGKDTPDLELYINNTMTYYRTNPMFVGFPTRYVDRYRDAKKVPAFDRLDAPPVMSMVRIGTMATAISTTA